MDSKTQPTKGQSTSITSEPEEARSTVDGVHSAAGVQSTVNAAQPGEEISVEDDQGALDETDSAFGDSDDASRYSASIATSIYHHVYENGRRYHSYRRGTYLNPDDEEEQDRLDLQHHIWKMIRNGGLYTAPLQSPLEILDLGTGTGIWAVDMAEEFPAATVTGTDISPIQPEWVPPNCHFYIDDFEEPWVFKKKFDYIHGRVLGGAVADWKKFHNEAFEHLKPGGWLEMQDYESYFFSDDGTLRDDSWLVSWTTEMNRGSVKFGKQYNTIIHERQWMIDAGFINIRSQVVKIPVGVWAKESKLKELGRYMEVQLHKAVDSYTPPMYTRILGYTIEETNVQMEMIKKDISDRKIHKYGIYHFICGQKPEA